MAGQKRWIITLSGRRPVTEVRRDLESAGFHVEQVLDAVGVITGTLEGPSASSIRRIDGIEDVSPDVSVDIGPPDSPSTW